jgi:hypothetical protein
VHIKVKLALEIVRAKLAKMRLVPDNEGGLANLMVPCPAREEGIYCGSNVLEVLLDEFALLEGGVGLTVSRMRDRGSIQTHDGSWWGQWGSPSYPPSRTIPLKSISLGINILSLSVVFIGPHGVVQRGCWPLWVMRDSAASRSIFSHIVWEFFLPLRRLAVGGWVCGVANEFKIFG